MNEFHDDEIINQFVIESLDLIGTAVEPDLLVLERDGARVSPAIITNLFQVMNNIKEIAGMLGLSFDTFSFDCISRASLIASE